MSKEILEITPSGGIYCLIPARRDLPARQDLARAPSYPIENLIAEIRAADYAADSVFRTDGDILRWALTRLFESGFARTAAYDARFENWQLAVDGDATTVDIDDIRKILTLPRHAESPSLLSRQHDAQMAFLFDLAKGLRLIWQDAHLEDAFTDLSPEDTILSERMRAADADLMAVYVAYQLRARGIHDMWRGVLSGDLHAIAITLSECLDFDGSDDGVLEALGFVFQDWFAIDARLIAVDAQTLQDLDMMERDGTPPEQMQFDDLIRLSMMPTGFSYLEYSASEILNDEYFARPSNDINTAHLKQIVQERALKMIEEIGFRDMDLARKFFPQQPSFETVV